MSEYKYPPLESFLPPGWKPDPVCCRAAAMRAAKGKKKRTPDEPACYGKDCGAKLREALNRLHDLK